MTADMFNSLFFGYSVILNISLDSLVPFFTKKGYSYVQNIWMVCLDVTKFRMLLFIDLIEIEYIHGFSYNMSFIYNRWIPGPV